MSTTTGSGDFQAQNSNGVTDFINNRSNTGKHITQTVASIGLEEYLKAAGRGVRGSIAGALVEPAMWVLSGKAPQPGDVALWGAGVAGNKIAGALGAGVGWAFTGVAAATILVKHVIEDDEDRTIARAIQGEPAKYRPFITSVRAYGASGRGIVAYTIASHGGVTWRVGRATWVFIRDAKGRLICAYEPKFSYEKYGPALPLRILERKGKITFYQWRRYPGTLSG